LTIEAAFERHGLEPQDLHLEHELAAVAALGRAAPLDALLDRPLRNHEPLLHPERPVHVPLLASVGAPKGSAIARELDFSRGPGHRRDALATADPRPAKLELPG